MDTTKQVDSSLVEAVKTFLVDQAESIALQQRSLWIAPWELAARISVGQHSNQGRGGINPASVEAALRELSIPCVKIAGSRRYLLAAPPIAAACYVQESLRPTGIARGFWSRITAIST